MIVFDMFYSINSFEMAFIQMASGVNKRGHVVFMMLIGHIVLLP